MTGTCIYVVRVIHWGTCDIKAVYSNPTAAFEHVHDKNFLREEANGCIQVLEQGVRSRKQLKEMHDDLLYNLYRGVVEADSLTPLLEREKPHAS